MLDGGIHTGIQQSLMSERTYTLGAFIPPHQEHSSHGPTTLGAFVPPYQEHSSHHIRSIHPNTLGAFIPTHQEHSSHHIRSIHPTILGAFITPNCTFKKVLLDHAVGYLTYHQHLHAHSSVMISVLCTLSQKHFYFVNLLLINNKKCCVYLCKHQLRLFYYYYYFFTANRDLGVCYVICTVLQYSGICRPSNHTVVRLQAVIRTREPGSIDAGHRPLDQHFFSTTI